APVTPFSLTSTAMAALRVPVLPYAAGTLLGMLPRAAVVTYFASRMTTADVRSPGGPWFVAAALVATLAIVWVLAWLGRQGRARPPGFPAPSRGGGGRCGTSWCRGTGSHSARRCAARGAAA